MSENFVVYIHSPKDHISEETIEKTIKKMDKIVNDAFDGIVYNFDKVEE